MLLRLFPSGRPLAVNLGREGRHNADDVLNQLLFVTLPGLLGDHLDNNTVAVKEGLENRKVESRQPVFVFDYNASDFVLPHQLEQLVQLGPVVIHPRAYLIQDVSDPITLVNAVFKVSSLLTV